jgi:ElaB/YqjD/DUF883 family membrane-anchored ribosome-binding protein
MEDTLPINSEGPVSREKLVHDLKALVRDAEDLVRETAGTMADKSKDELRRALDKLKASTRRIEEKAADRAEATDELIREHPYQSIGIAFGLGLLIGVLVAK